MAHHPGIGIGIGSARRHFGLTAQDGQRRAQFMADIGKEVGAAGIQRPQPVVAGDQRLGPFAQFTDGRFLEQLQLAIDLSVEDLHRFGALTRSQMRLDLQPRGVDLGHLGFHLRDTVQPASGRVGFARP